MHIEAQQNAAVPGDFNTQASGALVKWFVLCLVGALLLVFALLCYLRQTYTWVLAAAFAGCFLVSASWKRIRLLIKAGKAAKAGAHGIVISYRDKNLKESESYVLPAGSDTFCFYGFSPEKKAVKTFRWERILRALDNDKEMTKDDILNIIIK